MARKSHGFAVLKNGCIFYRAPGMAQSPVFMQLKTNIIYYIIVVGEGAVNVENVLIKTPIMKPTTKPIPPIIQKVESMWNSLTTSPTEIPAKAPEQIENWTARQLSGSNPRANLHSMARVYRTLGMPANK